MASIPTQLTSNGYQHTWACRAIQQQTKKPSEGARCRSQPYPWATLQLPQLSSGINRASLRIGTSAFHMPGSIEVLQARVQLPALATGLAQGPVHDSGTGTHWSFPTGSSLPSPYRARGLGHLPTLPQHDETVEHLVFQCPDHDQARRDTWPGDTFTTDPQRLWSYLKWIGVVTHPPPDRE